MPASRTDIHGPIPLCQMASIRLCRLLLPHCSWRARRFAAPQQHLPPIENPDSTEFCGWWNDHLKTSGMVQLITPYCVERNPAQKGSQENPTLTPARYMQGLILDKIVAYEIFA